MIQPSCPEAIYPIFSVRLIPPKPDQPPVNMVLDYTDYATSAIMSFQNQRPVLRITGGSWRRPKATRTG